MPLEEPLPDEPPLDEPRVSSGSDDGAPLGSSLASPLPPTRRLASWSAEKSFELLELLEPLEPLEPLDGSDPPDGSPPSSRPNSCDGSVDDELFVESSLVCSSSALLVLLGLPPPPSV